MNARLSLRAAGKTLKLGALSMLPSVSRMRHIDVWESQRGSMIVRTYASAGNRFPIVVLHGLTRKGSGDARLDRFCRMLAATGFQVYAPNLQGLCMMDPDPADVESIRALLKTLLQEHDAQIGLIGFSFGGTYALLASSSPDVAGCVRFVLAVGAYYSLEGIVERAFSLRGRGELSREAACAMLILDWKFRTMLRLTERETMAFEELMDRLCSGEQHLTPRDTALMARVRGARREEDIHILWKTRLREIPGLNIEGNPDLASLEASVFLLHSERDTSIPVEESVCIEDELTRRHKNVLRHIGRSGGHVTFPLWEGAGLARFFYRIMLLTESQDLRHARQSG